MANQIQLKRSDVAGRTPSANQLSPGELALNYADGKLFYKTSGGSVQSFGVVTAATTSSFPATGTTTNVYVATETQKIYRWDSSASAYVEVGSLSSGPVGATGPTGVTGSVGATGPVGPTGLISDGNKGDITVSNSGATLTINASAVTETDLANSARNLIFHPFLLMGG